LVWLSPHQFKVAGIDNSHPLVQEALRGRKPYELCWCGSGKKYKKCHRFRQDMPKLSLGEALQKQRKVFWKKRGCMHPLASPKTCSGHVIDAHSIQRKGPLSAIVDGKNHVSHLTPSDDRSDTIVLEIGWKKASTFPGYCAGHDSALFNTLEQQTFTGTHEQCVLLAFRNVCNELYKKRALIKSLEFQRDIIDRGCNLDEQINRQLSIGLKRMVSNLE